MTVDEKRQFLIDRCEHFNGKCSDCILDNLCLSLGYDLVTANETNINNLFEIVTSGKEEINHPDRYASGKYECIDVMQEVFGKEAVKNFCILNAFKYIWRSEKKNGVEDIKKAVWYLNKYIELGDVMKNE